MNGNGMLKDDIGDEYQLQVFNTPNSSGGIVSTLMINSSSAYPAQGLRNLHIDNSSPIGVNQDLESLRGLVFQAEATSNALRAEVEELKQVIQKLVDIRKVTNLTVSKEER